MVVALATIVVSLTSLKDSGVATVGVIPAGLPDFQWPSLRLRDVDGILPVGCACFLLAYIEGRDFVIPDDIKRLVVPTFAHRIVVNSRYSTGLKRTDEAEAALKEILRNINVPL